MEIIRHIKVDLYGDTQHFAVAAKQMDMGTRYIGVTLMEDGVVYEIPDNVEVIINMTKPDKTHVHNDGEKSGNEALIPLTRGMLQVHGTALCEVQLYQNGALLTSATFEMEIFPSQRDESEIIHSGEYTRLENTIAAAREGYDIPHPEKAWKPSRHGKVCINEGTSRKVRMIEKPRYNYEQVIHHIVVSACYDIFMKGMYEFSCGSVPNRGAHYGKKYIERWIQRDKKNCKYVLKMDIRHFFESVDHDVLKAWLKKKIRDERMLYILELIIDGSEVGLPLGFYTSQWLSNFMLQPLDHFIKEQLKAVHYIRYMDDMVVFGKNKKELHRMQQEIERFLREKFNLQMKGNWQVFRFDYTEKKTGKRKGRPLDFMGFQFYHDKTILRESIMLSCTRKVNRVAKKEKITWYDATAILSYMGYLSNTDTYDMYLQRVKPYVNVKKLKKIVSKHSKRKEREKHERMERSVRNGGRTAGGVRHNSVTDNGISETQYQESDERGCRRKENHRMAARGA